MANAKSSKSGDSILNSTWELFTGAVEKVKKNTDLWLRVYLLAVVPALVFSIAVALMLDYDYNKFVGDYVATPTSGGDSLGEWAALLLLISLPLAIYNVWLYATQISAFLAAQRSNANVTLNKVAKEGLDNFWRFLAFMIVMGIFITLGFVALVIPGIIMAVLFCYAPLVFIDQKVGIIEALKKSANMVTSNFVPLAVFALLAVVISIVVSIVSGIVGAVLPGQASDDILAALVNGALTIVFGLAFTKLYLSQKSAKAAKK